MIKAEDIWDHLREKAASLEKEEPLLAPLLQSNILTAESFAEALARILSTHLAPALLPEIARVHAASPSVVSAAEKDLLAILKHDPAAQDLLQPFLFFKGFHALQSHRIAHDLWRERRRHLAFYIQSRASNLFGIDIHPAAMIGAGVMMDHGTGIVIGETAVVEDDVLFWHGVTLGGMGTGSGDRHPKIRRGAQIGAGATILGAVEIGENSKIGAGGVVLKDIPAEATAVGVPAKVI